MTFKSSRGTHRVKEEAVIKSEDIIVNNIPVFGSDGKMKDSGISIDSLNGSGGGGGSYLPLSGGTMDGGIDMNLNEIVNVNTIRGYENRSTLGLTSSYLQLQNYDEFISNITRLQLDGNNQQITLSTTDSIGGVYLKLNNTNGISEWYVSDMYDNISKIYLDKTNGIVLNTTVNDESRIFIRTDDVTSEYTIQFPDKPASAGETFAMLSDITGGGDWLADGSYGPATGNWNMGSYDLSNVSNISNTNVNFGLGYNSINLTTTNTDYVSGLGMVDDGTININSENNDTSTYTSLYVDHTLGFGINNAGNAIWLRADNVLTNETFQFPAKGGTGGTFAMLSDIDGRLSAITPNLEDGQIRIEQLLDEVKTYEAVTYTNGTEIGNKELLTAGTPGDWVDGHFTGTTVNAKAGEMFPDMDLTDNTWFMYYCYTANNWFRWNLG